MPIYRFGTEEQKRQWLPDLCAGERLAAFGLTEPGGGVGRPAACAPRPALDGDEWVINGSKAFITNSGTDITSLVTVAAVTGGRGRTAKRDLRDHRPGRHARLHRRPRVLQGRLVRLGHPGAGLRRRAGARGEPARRARPRATPSSCAILDEGRVAIAALATGLAQGCVDECLRVRARARGVRPADRRLPGDPVHDRGHGGPGAYAPGWPGTTRRPGWRPGSRSSRRRPSPS